MRTLTIRLHQTSATWIAKPERGQAAIDSRRDEAIEKAKKNFLAEMKGHEFHADFARALAKKGGNIPKTKISLGEDGYYRVIVTYDLRPPAIWKQEQLV